MARETRRLGFVLGVVGALLVGVEALIQLVLGAVLLIRGEVERAGGVGAHFVILLVLAALIGGFSVYGRSPGGDRPLAAGVVLVVLALVGFLLLGLGSALLSTLGAVLALVAGVLYLVSGR